MAPRHQLLLPLAAILSLAPSVQLGSAEMKAEPVRFNRDIRPILAENCFLCHGPDPGVRKAGLRLDREADATAAREGSAAIVPGDPAASLAIQRIRSRDPSEVMPPPESKKKLEPAAMALLERWIAEGARYEPHWAFVPPRRPPVPEVKSTAWPRNEIDRFILARLEKAGLEPAPEADRRTLARRAALDITGLPPAPEEVERFLADDSPKAYEDLIDRLMASERWGEHRSRYWLDAARYADTHGIHFDNYREMWIYRDWVIRAFNENVPFDRFTTEQIAGDLLPARTLDQQIATGFNRCNITTNEGGAIDEEYLVLYTRDRTETISQVFLGLTAGCATCHDHKYDPLTQREFYELAAFFNNTTQGAMDGNIKDTPPVLSVPRPEDRERFDRLGPDVDLARKRLDERRQAMRTEFERWLPSASAETLSARIPREGLELHAPLSEGKGASVEIRTASGTTTLTAAKDLEWEAGHVSGHALKGRPESLTFPDAGDFEKDRAFSFGAWVKLPRDATGTIFARMDDREGKGFPGWDMTLDRGRVGLHLVRAWPDDGMKVVTKDPVPGGKWQHVFVTYDGSAKASGVSIYVNGDLAEKSVKNDALKGSIRTGVPFRLLQRETGSVLEGAILADVRIYGRALPAEEVASLVRGTRSTWIASKPSGERTKEESEELYESWLESTDGPFREARSRALELEKEKARILARGTVAHVSEEKKEPAMAYILYRGEYDKRRDKVFADTPDALPPLPAEYPRNRLGFARWLLAAEHPLTARVTVNRIWQEVFGTGIVRTAGDFGIMGELPSHPELLDWLAVEFREGGWDMKRFYKLLLTSAAYRQSAVTTPEKIEKDPPNRLLSRGPRFRMDAEMLRDQALGASGLLSSKIGGPSVKPYQPEGVWEAVAMPESNTRNYQRDSGENLYRRSLYTFWKRAAPPASMDVFNAPAREVCTVRRERTNTPLQALVTMNDVQFVEAAKALAALALERGGESLESRADFVARRLIARPFRPQELDVVRASVEDLLEHYRAHPDDARALIDVGEMKPGSGLDPASLAAWTMAVNQLMNLDEFLVK